MNDACPFCTPPANRIAFITEDVIALWDGFPVSPGHLLLVPKRHVPTWFEASEAERAALLAALGHAREVIEQRHRPDGYNIGINLGRAAGQTVFHLHVHLIPRYENDVPDPRGGVRHVVPARANYLVGALPTDLSSRLVEGGSTDPLFPELVEQFSHAAEVDIAVGFVMPSGMDCVETHLQELLARGGRLRLLTGDYLGITDPTALMRLIDLEGNREVRVFQTANALPPPAADLSFHPKSYLFRRADGTGIAYVGSSNLSDSALTKGVEWNYRTVFSANGDAYEKLRAAFERLFTSAPTTPLTAEWVDSYRKRRRVMYSTSEPPTNMAAEIVPPPDPHPVQREALAALDATRAAGYGAGLVVMATGLGKTWLAAFDTKGGQYRRVLFVAHREEILDQAKRTFRRIRPEARLGHYTGQVREPDAEVLFASIQTLGRPRHLEAFSPTSFDYIVVDEFHHAAAATYRRLIQHFRPRFLLGLTATPERTDGGDLLALCEENLVYRCDLLEGLRRNLLSRFEYFGVPDEVDYTNIPWRNSRFDETELTARLATEARAADALHQLETRGGSRAIAFCVSQRHADFMAGFFNQHGRRAVAVHAGQTSAPRAASLERLSTGQLDVICAVDVFNEGLDLPDLDTLLMLRPTESRIVWLQQFGRGLRKTATNKILKVIDYIGNHRAFLLKPQTLFSLSTSHAEVLNLLEQAGRDGRIEVAEGCFVTYDLKAIDILRGLLRVAPDPGQAMRNFYEDFRERNGARPTASETFHEGYNPRAARSQFGGWAGLVREMGDLTPPQAEVEEQHRVFLKALETTDMVKSFKMLVVLAMLNLDAFPGECGIEDLAAAVLDVAARNPHLRAEIGPEQGLRQMLERNPINAWTGGRGTGGFPYFTYADQVFRSTITAEGEQRLALQALTRELAEWRLAEYLRRSETKAAHALVCPVSHSGGRPILRLPDRVDHPELPEGVIRVRCDDTAYEAVFAKVAINVVKRSADQPNQLPTILRGWFGPDAGQPGTRHEVALEPGEDGWMIRPIGRASAKPELWRAYSREQIPPLFGLKFSHAIWNTGYVRRGNQIFLLVTLDKSTKAEGFQYEDRFLSSTLFQWQSQNRTRPADADGQAIEHHEKGKIPVHLFVRKHSKISNRSAPFTYCGDVLFRDWERKEPITVRWALPEALPERLYAEFSPEDIHQT